MEQINASQHWPFVQGQSTSSIRIHMKLWNIVDSLYLNARKTIFPQEGPGVIILGPYTLDMTCPNARKTIFPQEGPGVIILGTHT